MLDNLDNIDALIARKLDGTLTQAEQAALSEWIAADATHLSYYQSIQEVWGLTGRTQWAPEPDVSDNWMKFQSKLQAQERPNELKVVHKANNKRTWLRVAAIALPILIATPLIYNHFKPSAVEVASTTIRTANGEKKTLQLADGTTVHLNENSSLAYNNDFNTAKRNIQLTGEAFFDVAQNDTKPFAVTAGRSRTEVLGTSFNIKAYHPQPVEIAVTSGKVAFMAETNANNKVVLTAGHKGILQLDETITTQPIDAPVFTQWREMRFTYHKDPFSKVINDVEKTFGIDIEVSDAEILKTDYNGLFTTQMKVPEVLEVITITTGTQWKFENGKYIISHR
ncbi:FecR family protein [Chitinophaga skermanii]|uniref:FecR family protein n=1 Tax=Chitinophaga skermanii TaxID=331697 RepID=A0A327R1S7_9BACT|nr:FecR family protein [Chitinophaga skermanii]RAJ10591.1 FecR family protein [Chitinophaga skermanii]